ncbi:MAG TPA: TIGR03086 family metal-binding protein [Streptomyces sp.]|nr:TIGR03086 family metal-binding protein [Streptomyces sp.]
MNATPDLGPATRRLARLLARVTDEQLAAPTPCQEYAVRDLLAHLVHLTAAFRDAAKKQPGSAAELGLGEDWRGRLAEQLDELAVAWRSPDAWEGVTQAGGMEFPASLAGRIALNEVVLHGWDLARATGQPYDADPESLRCSYEMLAPVADDPSRREMFGPPVPVPADAPLVDRVVALSGRSPSWSPPVE